MAKKEKKPVIAVFGLGYVGLTLGAVLADTGYQVLGIEPRKKSIEQLKKGIPHIHEEGLPELLKKHLNKNFRVFDKPQGIEADVFVVAVGTPVEDDKRKPRLDYVQSASQSIGQLIRPGGLVILRSTVPVGTTRNVVIPVIERESGLKAGKDFSVVFAPERMAEGSALAELRTIPQIIGGVDKTSVLKASRIFENFVPRIIAVSTLEIAELVKLFNNTYRDVTFGFANELALICDGFNIDPSEVISASNDGYKRCNIPRPSPGVGGYCLTKDPFILLHSTTTLEHQPSIVFNGRRVNQEMPDHVAGKVVRFLKSVVKKPLSQATVGILGFAFKGHPPTTDVRFSPTEDVIRDLKEVGVRIIGHDPLVDAALIRQVGAKPVKKLSDAFNKTDVVLIMTNHMDYRDPNLLKLTKKMNKPGLFFDPWQLHPSFKVQQETGLHYSNLGFDSFRNFGTTIFDHPGDIPKQHRFKERAR